MKASKNKEIGQPIAVIIGRLEDVSKKDAIEYAKVVIEKYLDNPENSFYRVLKHEGSYFYEVHEGGEGKSYLESLIEMASASEEHKEIIISSAKRHLKVVSDGGFFTFHVLPSSQRPPATEGIVAKKRMTPNASTGKTMLVTGISSVLMSIGMIASASVIHIMSYNTYETPERIMPQEEMHKAVAIMESFRAENPDRYISKVSFSGGSWDVQSKQVPVNYRNTIINPDLAEKYNEAKRSSSLQSDSRGSKNYTEMTPEERHAQALERREERERRHAVDGQSDKEMSNE